MRAEHTERLDGVASTVENQIGGVEIDADVRAVHVFQKALQHMRGLLAGFERKGLLVLGCVVGYATDHFADLDVIGMSGVLGNKSDVAGEASDIDGGGEV